MSKKKKYKLIVVSGEKGTLKNEYVNYIINSVDGNFLNSDIEKINRVQGIKTNELFGRQKDIIQQVAKNCGVNIIVNVSDSYDKKWKRIAKEFDLDYEHTNLSDFDSISAKDVIEQRILRLEDGIKQDKLRSGLDKSKK